MIDVCNDDHSASNPGSSLGPCPMHGYDDSIPPPPGFRWIRHLRPDGQVYAALTLDEPSGRAAA